MPITGFLADRHGGSWLGRNFRCELRYSFIESVVRDDAIDEADQTIAREREAETEIEIDPEVEDAERNRE